MVDPESGLALGAHARGELCFRGPMVMAGYYNDPSATAAATDAEGFLRSGDVGYYDEQGYFFVVDRLKELIKYKAFQVPAAAGDGTRPGSWLEVLKRLLLCVCRWRRPSWKRCC